MGQVLDLQSLNDKLQRENDSLASLCQQDVGIQQDKTKPQEETHREKELVAEIEKLKVRMSVVQTINEDLMQQNHEQDAAMKESKSHAENRNSSKKKELVTEMGQLKSRMSEMQTHNQELWRENESLRDEVAAVKEKETEMQGNTREQELASHVDQLKSRVSELQSLNDKLQTTNESLGPQSINKEENEKGAEENTGGWKLLRSKLSEMQSFNEELWEENESLRQKDAEMQGNTREQELASQVDQLKSRVAELQSLNDKHQTANESLGRLSINKEEHEKGAEENILRSKLSEMQSFNEELWKENESLRQRTITNADNVIEESQILRQELDELKQRKNAAIETLREEIDELRQKNTHLEATSNHLKRIQSSEEGKIDESVDAGNGPIELEVEIAELREKVLKQEELSTKQKQEIESISKEREEMKERVNGRAIEISDLENMLSTSKETWTVKMKQKDETITFMQDQMRTIMQEKQNVDKKIQKKTPQRRQSKEVDETDSAKMEALNKEISRLNEENSRLEGELIEFKYNNSLQLVERQSVVLQLRDKLGDAKRELRSRDREADVDALLKDKRESKILVEKTMRDLRASEEKGMELELKISQALSNKKDLEKEVESLSLSKDLGEHMSGLRRQIKSLREHNITLERKLEVESRESEEYIQEKDATIRILRSELEKFNMKEKPPGSKRQIPEESSSNRSGAFLWGMFSPQTKDSEEVKIDNLDIDLPLDSAETEAGASSDEQTHTKGKDVSNDERKDAKGKDEVIKDGGNDDDKGGFLWGAFSPQTKDSEEVKIDNLDIDLPLDSAETEAGASSDEQTDAKEKDAFNDDASSDERKDAKGKDEVIKDGGTDKDKGGFLFGLFGRQSKGKKDLYSDSPADR